ncbi:MAG: glycosyltransferase [Sporomusaceae bacterium]|jgi:GT2 family glycosyltransferase/2-polyprenyl-3-methyl-5-hydroxy-6-metoxy-1,4-benzoquinol methylase|nr:glycosyltransferase [Sporomusaceae bacterium]
MKKTSIIILTYNQLDYTKICLESIKLYTQGDYEIIVVDNASSDGTAEWLKGQKEIITIFNTENKGFPAGCNQGILRAEGEVIVLLNNDTIVTPHWLDNLVACLESSADIGAAGPATNANSYYQYVDVDYEQFDFQGLVAFAAKNNRSHAGVRKERLKLTGFCLAVKKEVIAKIGLLDEIFSPGYAEDDDFCVRMIQAGYKIMFCADSFVHHFGKVSFAEFYKDPAKVQGLFPDIGNGYQKFQQKWGFQPQHSDLIRLDTIKLITENDAAKKIRVLEIGCACGATLLEIKNLFPKAQIYGIELNEHSARIANYFAQVQIGDAEKMEFPYPENYFDYILCPNILEHLVDPWKLLGKLKKYLKPTGHLIASILNVMHFSVVAELLSGNWDYRDEGILAKTHLRFFTLNTMKEMLANSGYSIKEIKNNVSPGSNFKTFLDQLEKLVPPDKKEELLIFQYLVKAEPVK